MRPALRVFFLLIPLASLTACGAESGPADVVERSYRAVEEGDAEAFISTLDPAVVALFRSKIVSSIDSEQEKIEQKGGIDSIDVLSEEEQEEQAEVVVRIEYGDGTSEEQDITLSKYEGDWKISLSK